jgi:NitT/TauT family transport system substrate-binding protein
LSIRLTSITTAALVTAAVSQVAHAEPLRIFYFQWAGYGPLFLAQEKGLFAKEGIEVSLINNEIHAAAFAGLLDGQVDAVATAIIDAPAASEPDDPVVCVLVIDDSRGADGIVATEDIQSVADLEGRSVASLREGLQEFYLSVLLERAGLSPDAVEVVDLIPEDAAQAFLLGEVDAAVTFEPWLSQAANAEHGHLLIDSSETPGLIVDCLLTTAANFERRGSDFEALGRAWDAAVSYVEAHPEEAHAIMASAMGDWLDDPAVFAETLDGLALYDADQNREYFGSPAAPGQIYETMQYAIDVWSSLGRLKTELTPADVIGHGIFNE